MIKIPEAVHKSENGLPDSSPYRKIISALEIKTLAGEEALLVALANIKLLDNKQLDYGSKNISGFGSFGVVVRMNDKFERLKNLYNNRRRKATNESILDSFDDISNYAIIAHLVETKKWPNE